MLILYFKDYVSYHDFFVRVWMLTRKLKISSGRVKVVFRKVYECHHKVVDSNGITGHIRYVLIVVT